MNTLEPRSGSTLIVGMGRTGRSLLEYLESKGRRVALYDDRPIDLQVRGERPSATGLIPSSWWSHITELAVSPGIPPRHRVLVEARRRAIPVYGDIEYFAKEVRHPVLGITGTNGKSTVVSLLGEIARRSSRRVGVGGNYGVPALDLLRDRTVELFILELSSFQLALTEHLRTEAAAILNVAEDHLDWHGTMEAYAAAKERIFRHTKHAIGNRDDAWVRAMLSRHRDTKTSFGASPPLERGDYGLAEEEGRLWLVGEGQRLLAADEIKLPGRHNLLNVLATWAVARVAGFDDRVIRDVVTSFAGLSHRLQCVRQYAGVTYYDDSKATNVSAAIAALEALSQPTIVILGGLSKGQSFAPLAQVVRGRVKVAILIGTDAPTIAKELEGACPCVKADDLDEAVTCAARFAEAGDAVLLAPACASFDMFRDYVDRGDKFRQAVNALGPSQRAGDE